MRRKREVEPHRQQNRAQTPRWQLLQRRLGKEQLRGCSPQFEGKSGCPGDCRSISLLLSLAGVFPPLRAGYEGSAGALGFSERGPSHPDAAVTSPGGVL